MAIQLTPQSKATLREVYKNLRENFPKALKKSVFQIGNEMKNEGVQNAPYDTGTLRRSIKLERSNAGYTVKVGSNVPYAKIHDQGGLIRAHEIRPKRKKFLRFWVGGKEVYTKLVKKPPRRVRPYKGKGYLTPAFRKQMNGKAEKTIIKFVTEAING